MPDKTKDAAVLARFHAVDSNLGKRDTKGLFWRTLDVKLPEFMIGFGAGFGNDKREGFLSDSVLIVQDVCYRLPINGDDSVAGF